MELDSQYVTAPPAPPLGAFIERYVGYRLTGFAPGVHRGLPSRYLTFIVSIGPTIDVIAQADPSQAPASYRCVVSGLQGRSATIGYGAHQEGVQVDVSPLGARMLFGMPSRVLWDASVECSDVVGRPGGELWERLQGVPDWPGRFAVCDEMLMRWANAGGCRPRSAGASPGVAHARAIGREHRGRRSGQRARMEPPAPGPPLR